MPLKTDRLLNESITRAFTSSGEQFDAEIGQIFADNSLEHCAAAFAELFWDNSAQCWDKLSHASVLQPSSRTCKTVGIYYNCITTGGAEKITCELTRLWTDMGYKVVLFTDFEKQPNELTIPDSVERVALNPFWEVNRFSYGTRAELLKEGLAKHNVDVFVYAQWLSPVLPWDMIVARAMGIPFIIYTLSSLRTMFCEANPIEYQLSSVFRYADGLIVLNKTDARFWGAFNPHTFFDLNPNTLKTDKAKVSPLDSNEIVWIGRLASWDKQPADALHIMKRVLKEIPDAHISIIGPAHSEEELEALKATARSLGISNHVTFTGAVNNVPDYIRKASVHLMTSRYEGFCFVLAESKTFGVPCVTYDMPYLTLAEGNRGLISVAHHDYDGAANAIVRLLSNKDELRALGQQAFDHAVEIEEFDRKGLWSGILEEVCSAPLDRSDATSNDMAWDMLLQSLLESLGKTASQRDAQERRAIAAERLEAQTKQQLRELENSTTVKVGKAITVLPRFAKDRLNHR